MSDSHDGGRMRFGWLELVVFCSGAAVLCLEILGTRILGPYYGVSLFLWTALITVALVALSVGYAVGGRVADRGPRPRILCGLVAGAGAWVLVIPLLRRPVLMLTEPLGLRPAVLLAALLLFAPPLTLLGMVSPYAIRLRTSSLDRVGTAAGDLYAISTVGSVLAALLTGFVLIPRVGVLNLTLGIGAMLLVVAAATLIRAGDPLRHAAILGALLLPGAAWIGAEAATPHPGSIVASADSPYADVRVVDYGGLRHLLIDGGIHSIIDPETGQSRHPYTHVLDLTRTFFDRQGSMLLVGLGGGSVARSAIADGWKVEAVEIDPIVVAEYAVDYFGLSPGAVEVHVMDGRSFVARSTSTYELIVMDAFGSAAIPFHLVTREAFETVADRLADDGVLVLNLESVGWHDVLVRAIVATLEPLFTEITVLPAHIRASEIGNVVVVASDRELAPSPLPDRFGDDAERTRAFAWQNRYRPITAGVEPLTDDHSRIELWAERINLVARRDLHAYFGLEGTDW